MDEKKMLRSLKIARAKVRNILDVFSPCKYSPEVVKANKDLWIKNAQDAFDVVIELSIDLEEIVSPSEAHEIYKSNEALKDEFTKFVFSTNTKALSVSNSDQHPVTSNFDVSEIQTKLDCDQFSTFSGNNENVLKENEIQEEDYDEQLRKSEPRGSFPNSIKNLNDDSSSEIIQTQGEYLMDVQQSVLLDVFNLPSVDQRFRGQVFNCGTLWTLLFKFPAQEMHVMLQMFSGSIQRSLNFIIDYIQLPLCRYVDSMSFIQLVPTHANASFARS